ncbi:MAG TPA: hypothetical protein H9950_08940 [Candidatus Bacteroides avicola]|uniref:Uncharacterized protein n=1 Tax=Candidatus Bacteroides avicola TaxID=2838468 RepID=A0A9D2HY76_9BACE|nr:hypothetical protein [Candidatus Bacteroides avicola]
MDIRALLGLRRPRGYHHTYIYVDERREQLEQRKEAIRRELGLAKPSPPRPEDIRGKFVEATTHLRRSKQKGRHPTHIAVLLFFIGLLSWLWYALANGKL